MALFPVSELQTTGKRLAALATLLLGSSVLAAPAIANGSPTPQAQSIASSELLRTLAQAPELPPLAEINQYLPNAQEVHLVLRLGERKVHVYQGDRIKASYPVAIGKASTPTPTGTYEVFQMIKDPVWQSPWTGRVTQPGPNSALGVRWIGFAQMSNGIIGFHGTPTVNSIGHAASNGCVRMYNRDVLKLFASVEMGTKVIVER